MPESVFQAARVKNYPYRYRATLFIPELHGGTPQNQDVAIDHIKRQLADRGELLQAAVAEYMADQAVAGEEVNVDEAAVQVAMAKNLNGFKRDDKGLFIEGRHLKASLKEAVSVACNSGNLQLKGWGETKKWATKWFPEHVFVLDTKLHLNRETPDGISQRFVVSRHGTGIQLEEYVLDAQVTATIVSDYDLGDDAWAAIWTTAEMNGIGSSRSQGYGTFDVVEWELISKPPKKGAKKGAMIDNDDEGATTE